MNFEKAFQETLIKWQEIAAGKLHDPNSDCGLCRWAGHISPRVAPRCAHCPAWHHYEKVKCGDAVPVIGEAIYCYGEAIAGDEELGVELRDCAQKVVLELLAIKESLFEWADKLKEG